MVVTTEYCEVLYVEADHMRRIYEVTLHYDVLHSAILLLCTHWFFMPYVQLSKCQPILLMCTPYVTHCVCINQDWLGVMQCYAMLHQLQEHKGTMERLLHLNSYSEPNQGIV